jgi:hypothetical protein
MNGHNICSKCREREQCCLTCRAEIRNVVLENIARSQKYPCANRQSGCLELFSIEHIAKHHSGCVYEKIKCPRHVFKTSSWKDLKNDLKEHAKAAYPKYFFEESSFRISTLEELSVILFCFGQLFTVYKHVRDGRFYDAVQLIGTNSEASKYKCEFTLRAANGIERISTTCLVQGYSEDWETTFNSGKCLSLEEVRARDFFVHNKLNFNMTLSTV